MKSHVIYGFHAVQAFLQAHPTRVHRLAQAEGRQDQRMEVVLSLARQHQIPIERHAKEALTQIAGSPQHQGVLAWVAGLPEYQEADLSNLIAENPGAALLLLDSVQDPHNLGACLRTANAMGIAAVVVPKDRAARLNQTVMKVACGGALFTPLICVTNLVRTMKKCQDDGMWFVGLEAEAQTILSDVDLTGSVGIVMGSEGEGLRRLVRAQCDFLASIPMHGCVSSLNVSVATGMALYERVRQRR